MGKVKRKTVLMIMRNVLIFSLPQNRNPLWSNSIMLLLLRNTLEIDFGFSGLTSYQVILFKFMSFVSAQEMYTDVLY